MKDSDRCNAIELLGRIPCEASGYLKTLSQQGGTRVSKCLLCEGKLLPMTGARSEEHWEDTIRNAILTLGKIIKSRAFIDSRRPRVLTMLILRRFALHVNNSELLDLEISALGQWCLSSLKSSMRELRVAAG